MADYSEPGNSCSCGARDRQKIDSHRWDCLVPEQIARQRRKDQLKKQAEEAEKIERVGRWEAYDDQQLIDSVRQARRDLDVKVEEMRAVQVEWWTGIDIIKKRDLIQEVLRSE